MSEILRSIHQGPHENPCKEHREETSLEQVDVPKLHKAKKVKITNNENKENKAPPVQGEKPFTAAQNKQIAKMAESYKKMIADLTEIHDNIIEKSLSDFMPRHLTNKLATHKNKLEVEAAELDICIGANTGDIKVVKTEFAEAKLATKELSSRLESAAEEAATAAEEAATAAFQAAIE
jgi:hypothetical protein